MNNVHTKIFIAEDDESLRKMYSAAFSREGYNVEAASDGEEALNKLMTIKDKPSVILLDIMMPKMNGIEVLNELKKNQILGNIPVIMLTNMAGKEVDQALENGAVLYLIKGDYTAKMIVDKVEEIIEAYKKKGERSAGDIPEVTVSVKEPRPTQKG